MSFCQLAQAKSLREMTQGLASCEGRLRQMLTNLLNLSAGPPSLLKATPSDPIEEFGDCMNVSFTMDWMASANPSRGHRMTSTRWRCIR